MSMSIAASASKNDAGRIEAQRMNVVASRPSRLERLVRRIGQLAVLVALDASINIGEGGVHRRHLVVMVMAVIVTLSYTRREFFLFSFWNGQQRTQL